MDLDVACFSGLKKTRLVNFRWTPDFTLMHLDLDLELDRCRSLLATSLPSVRQGLHLQGLQCFIGLLKANGQREAQPVEASADKQQHHRQNIEHISIHKHNQLNEKSAEATQTLRAGCTKAEPKIFTPPQTPFPG